MTGIMLGLGWEIGPLKYSRGWGGLPVCRFIGNGPWALVDQEGKYFFFVKKKQKTFGSLGVGVVPRFMLVQCSFVS
ncbi:hypothetical protein AruPA_12620 [Acidiphilium sp. PA]|uniref:hypothetical protein n=1 Tax=Acidiphilium sp. PA TaxID=2871705 RepID=UPI0022448190|nr:hypothetical protein [Acidiphilium sp. PA]MCW8307885.1 hypothetical protein [Acidiphilium sp. PA]